MPAIQATLCSAARLAWSRSPVAVKTWAAAVRIPLPTYSLAAIAAVSVASSCSAVAAERSPRIVVLSACAPSSSGVNWLWPVARATVTPRAAWRIESS